MADNLSNDLETRLLDYMLKTANSTNFSAPASLWVAMAALAAVCVLLGVYPQAAYPLLNKAALSIAGVLPGH